MKKIRKNIVLGTAGCLALGMTACAPIVAGTKSDFSSGKSGNVIKGYAYDVTDLPVKDFEVVKLVFARDIQDETDKTPPLNVWHDLMIKAQEAGAHAIINVNIEESKSCQEMKENGDKDKHCMITRYGSALAIKFTNTVTGGDNEFRNTVISGKNVSDSFKNKNQKKTVSDSGSKIMTKEKAGEILRGYSFDVTTLPMKNYEPVKMIFARAVIDDSMKTPPSMLYHDLLIKASELGAHAVINVNIEESKFCDRQENTDGSYSQHCNVVRYGAGLAIKYTDSIILGWEDGKNSQKTKIAQPAKEEAKPAADKEPQKAGGLGGLFK